jgi:hypothetical protein
MAAEETDGVESDGVERERERRGLREFWDEKGNDTGRADIYRFKNIRSIFKPESMLIVLKFGLKQF